MKKAPCQYIGSGFFFGGRRGGKLPSQWPYDTKTPPVPREHSYGGACSEPLDLSPWLSLSLLPRPLNLAVKGLFGSPPGAIFSSCMRTCTQLTEFKAFLTSSYYGTEASRHRFHGECFVYTFLHFLYRIQSASPYTESVLHLR